MEVSYKEKYEQALSKAKDMLNYKEVRREDMEYIFPELAESEDEKVREELIKHLKEGAEGYEPAGGSSDYQRWLAWLEDQGMHKPDYCHHEVDLSNCSEEYRKAYYDGWNNCNMQYSQCKSESNDVVKCLINGMKFYYEDNEEATWGTEKFSMKVKDILTWLERQGEHANFRNKIQVGDKVTRNEAGVLVNLSQLKRVAKPNEEQDEQKTSCTSIVETGNGGINALVTRELPTEMKSAEESLGIDSDTYNKIVDECIFGEQKPEDKIEPKFKVGDWVVNKLGNVWHIDSFDKKNYQVSNGNGYNYFPISKQNEMRLWTIQDAKDGDVLEDNDGVILFRKIGNERYADVVDYYCVVNTSGRFEIQEKFDYWGEANDAQLHPATEIQRYTLMKAMADAGYTFDFENKKLKKIEQNPAWSEEDDSRYSSCLYMLEREPSLYNWLKSLGQRIKGE